MHHCPGYSSIPKADKKRAFHFFMAHFERAPLPILRYSHMVFWRIHGSPMHSFGWPWMSRPIRQFSITLLAHVAAKLGKRTSVSVYKLLILVGRCHYVRPTVLFSSDGLHVCVCFRVCFLIMWRTRCVLLSSRKSLTPFCGYPWWSAGLGNSPGPLILR